MLTGRSGSGARIDHVQLPQRHVHLLVVATPTGRDEVVEIGRARRQRCGARRDLRLPSARSTSRRRRCVARRPCRCLGPVRSRPAAKGVKDAPYRRTTQAPRPEKPTDRDSPGKPGPIQASSFEVAGDTLQAGAWWSHSSDRRVVGLWCCVSLGAAWVRDTNGDGRSANGIAIGIPSPGRSAVTPPASFGSGIRRLDHVPRGLAIDADPGAAPARRSFSSPARRAFPGR